MHDPIRIGFLVDSLLSRYQVRLFNGAWRAARQRDAQLIGFQGSFLTRPSDAVSFDGSFLYELASPVAVDGLLVVSNILAGVVGTDAVQTFCLRSRLPVVSIGALARFPHVDAECKHGLKTVIEHLVTAHGRRRLAFIQGKPGNPESAEREAVFRRTLSELGIEVSEQFILPGTFLEGSGASAMRTLFDERGVEPSELDGVVAANDQMAVGATRELLARRIRVPEDVAIVGFDDDDHARSNSPPLTTVAQPIERLGERAAELLLEHLAGRPTPERTILGTEPVFRRSCGCTGAGLAETITAESLESLEAALADRQVVCTRRLEKLLGQRADTGGVEALMRVLLSRQDSHVEAALADFERALLSSHARGLDPLRWEDVVLPLTETVERFARADAANSAVMRQRVLRARSLMNEVAARIHSLERLHVVQHANAVRVLGTALACARNLQALAQAVETGLSGLGIKYCCVCLFVEGSERKLATAVARYESLTSTTPELVQDTAQLWRALPGTLPPSAASSSAPREALVFPANELVHPKLAPLTMNLDLLTYPLVFAERALGYVVFDAPEHVERAWMLENVAGHLSGSVYAITRADELRDARELSEKASAAKSEFVAMMSHEVRTPLTAISGHLDLCLKTALSQEQRGHLTRARSSSRALLEIVDNILDFSKIEARRLELESVRFELPDVLDQLIGTHGLIAARKNLEFVIDPDPSVPRSLVGDPLRLSQVLVNLVGNALKFSSKGHVLLRIELVDEAPSSGVTLRFRVSDSGIGMSEQQVAQIFQPFTQADSSTTRRYGGTGLGLSICKRLVEMMGGELQVRSKLEQGSEFSFSASFGAPLTRSVPSPAWETLRVLLVESSEPQAQAFCRLLAAHGCEVTAVGSAAEALSALSEASEAGTPFQVAVVSHTLPDAAGLSLIARITRPGDTLRVPAVVLGPPNAEFWVAGNFRRYGASAAIAKPFQPASVLRALERASRFAGSSRPPSQAPVSQDLRLQGKTLLLVQDEAVGREMFRELLEQWGARVEVANNGLEAVQRASSQAFDAILMDLHMPLLDGWQAAHTIRSSERHAETPILALTASTRAEDRARAREAGMVAFLSTPIDPTQLLGVILEVLPSGEDRLGESSGGEDEDHDSVPPASVAASRLRMQLDTQSALARVNGDAATYRRLLQRFLASHATAPQDLKRALDESDIETALRIAHTLTSAAANVGANQLQRAAQFMESTLRQDASQVAMALADFEFAHLATLTAVASTLESSSSSPNLPQAAVTTEVAPLLARLRRLIEDHDTAAVDCLNSLRQALGERPSASEALHRLEIGIAAYDFEQARKELDALNQVLAPREFELPRS
ncbi:MAG TPA: substrate-binding domain-containing protein [Polyangiaceae bacterium]|nr:substrate-binding domain-containing protein [Polyangiaceae bacterium]